MYKPYNKDILRKLVERGYTCGVMIPMKGSGVPEQNDSDYEDFDFRELKPFKSETEMEKYIEREKIQFPLFTIFEEDGIEIANGMDGVMIYINTEL